MYLCIICLEIVLGSIKLSVSVVVLSNFFRKQMTFFLSELEYLFLTCTSFSSFCILWLRSFSSRQRFLSSEVSSWTYFWDWASMDSWVWSLTQSRTGHEKELNWWKNLTEQSANHICLLIYCLWQSLGNLDLLKNENKYLLFLMGYNKYWDMETHTPFQLFPPVALWVSTAWRHHLTPH